MRAIRRFLAGLGCCLAMALPARALDIDVTSFTLENGLQVVVIPDRRAPVVTHMVWYRVGSADEPHGTSGIAHFLEHLMFKATTKRPNADFSRVVEANGGEDNAFTSKDYTAYFQRVAKDRLGLMMELEADRMQNLVLSEADVETERLVIIEERRQRTDNDPSSLLGEQLDAAMYLNHPYGRPVIGWKSEMEALTREDALSFYKRFYTPANAIVVVAGDVSAEEVRALAATHYGVLKNSFIPKARVRPQEPPQLAARRVTMADKRVAAPVFQRMYLAPSANTAKGLEDEALKVLAEGLGGGSTSLLYKRLVVEQKLATYAGAWYSDDDQDIGKFGIYATPVPGGDLAALEKAVDDILAQVRAKGLAEADVARAKNEIDAEAVYAQDDQATLARIFGSALTNGLTVEEILGWAERVKSVSAADVTAAAQNVLDSRRSVTGILLPESGDATTLN